MIKIFKPGLFISLEGIEGAGKSTVLATIQKVLQFKQIDHLTTREPGGTPIAEQIRKVFLTPNEEPLDPTTETLLVFAGRNQHVKQVILPALNQGKWVISDRFTDATYAYQGVGRGVNKQTIAAVEQIVLENFKPDYVILLDLPVDIALQRIAKRKSLDRIEQENLKFFSRIRQAYLERAHQDLSRYSIIDASQPLISVNQSIAGLIEKWIDEWQT